MAVADVKSAVELRVQNNLQRKAGLPALFCLLAAYTLFTLDGAEVAQRIISSAVLLLAAGYLVFPAGRPRLNLPTICLVLMSAYGLVQTLWFLQKIQYNGWASVLFWFT